MASRNQMLSILPTGGIRTWRGAELTGFSWPLSRRHRSRAESAAEDLSGTVTHEGCGYDRHNERPRWCNRGYPWRRGDAKRPRTVML